MSTVNETCTVADLQPLKSLRKQTQQLTESYDKQPTDIRKRIPVKRSIEGTQIEFLCSNFTLSYIIKLWTSYGGLIFDIWTIWNYKEALYYMLMP